MTGNSWNRRSFVGALAASGGLAAAGCKPSGTKRPQAGKTPGQAPALALVAWLGTLAPPIAEM
jgi:hypothetical protein